MILLLVVITLRDARIHISAFYGSDVFTKVK